jgi:broad specificity phosphatase PhoE
MRRLRGKAEAMKRSSAKATEGVPLRAKIMTIEHGSTEFDDHDLVHGHKDIPLNDEGRRESERLGRRLLWATVKPAHLYASDLKRAAETAHIAGQIAGIPVTTHKELRSLDVGKHSGKPEKQVAEQLKPYFAAPWKQIPGGERVASWRARVLKFVHDKATEHAAHGGLPAFVSHSNSLGAVKAKAKGGEDGRKAMANPPPSASAEVVNYPIRGRITKS